MTPYKLGDKPYSALCDYMESCSYKCQPEFDITEDNVSDSSYHEDFVNVNIEKILDDNKAQSITSINLKNKSYIADYMIIASGTSSRHLQSLSEILVNELKKVRLSELDEKENFHVSEVEENLITNTYKI